MRNTAKKLKGGEGSGELPEELLLTIRGFQESRVILTGIELNIFAAIGDGATAGQVAGKIGTDARATEMLLNALVAMGLLTKSDGVFHTTRVTARYFGGKSPDDARAAMMHTVHLWERWSTLTECVRAGTSVARREAAGAATIGRKRLLPRCTATLERGLRRWSKPWAFRVRGECSTWAAVQGRIPLRLRKPTRSLQVELLDLPEVLPIAQRHIEEAGLGARIKTRAGDLRTDLLGQGFDVILVSAICHMLGPDGQS